MPHEKEYQPETEFRTRAAQGREMPREALIIFSAASEMLSDHETMVLAALRRNLPLDGLLPVCAFSPSALAAACGQKHTGNMGSVFESLCRKGFIKYWKNKNMFHVKRDAIKFRGRE